MTDLLKFTAELVDIPSVSHGETAITDHLERLLAPVPWLEVTRLGDNVVARTRCARSQRLILAGHTDTVPPSGNVGARFEAGAGAGEEGDVLWGIGSADMKGGVAVLAELARTVAEPAVDVTYVFYECEEVDSRFNGVERLFRERPDLLEADAALLAEPTGARVEAGCQGTMRAEVTMTGRRAHSARAWKGVNAIHRIGPLLEALATHTPRQVEIDGCLFREGLQAVRVAGGVAGNVVPDEAVVTLNHRFAPDRTPAEAEDDLRRFVDEAIPGGADGFSVVDVAPGALPALGHPLLQGLLAATGGPPRAKLGWTDVARFATRGVPATNFGPGDPNVAHSAEERVSRDDLESVFATLNDLITGSQDRP